MSLKIKKRRKLRFKTYKEFLQAPNEVQLKHPAYAWTIALDLPKEYNEKDGYCAFDKIKSESENYSKSLRKINYKDEQLNCTIYEQDEEESGDVWICIYVEKDNNYIGSIYLGTIFEDTMIEVIHSYVIPEYRRAGIGKQMYNILTKEIAQKWQFYHDPLYDMKKGSSAILSKIYFNSTPEEIVQINKQMMKAQDSERTA